MHSFLSAVSPPKAKGSAYWFIFKEFRLLVHEEDSGLRIPYLVDPASLPVQIVRSQFLGYLVNGEESVPCYSAEADNEAEPPAGMAFLGLRRLFEHIDDTFLALAGRAVQIMDWDRTHQYCGHCGSSVEQIEYERAKKCPVCELTTYPRLSPAIIVSVERKSDTGTELLLARNKRHPRGFFSVLAGFVEPGESLEECVQREVREEVGIEVGNIRYFGSQPWPFPNSLMIAFTAEYIDGQILLEEEEIAEAGWYKADSLPLIPPPVSIARQLIETFVRKNSIIE